MAFISQKCQYALRAIHELAKQYGRGPIKIADIAQTQAIPPRFLEVILGQLKQGGFVESQRGSEGGYRLVRTPRDLTVGEIIRFVQGPIAPVACLQGDPRDSCELGGDCVFIPMWAKVHQAVSAIYDTTTFQDFVDEEIRRKTIYVPAYQI